MPTLSPDNRFHWNGQTWMPVPPAKDSATWWSDAPDWMGPVLLNGLILLIPAVGQMVVYGWVLAARDELRAGRNLVPHAGFSYLSRGWRPFVAQLIWGAVFALVWAVFGALLALCIVMGVNSGVGVWQLLAVFVGVVGGFAFLVSAIVQLVILVPLIAISDEVGLGAALSPGYVWDVVRAYPSEVKRGVAIYVVGYIASVAIGSLCSCLLVAGVFATAATLLSLAAPLARVQLTAPPASL